MLHRPVLHTKASSKVTKKGKGKQMAAKDQFVNFSIKYIYIFKISYSVSTAAKEVAVAASKQVLSRFESMYYLFADYSMRFVGLTNVSSSQTFQLPHLPVKLFPPRISYQRSQI